jgi:protein-tyrosine phosphatase
MSEPAEAQTFRVCFVCSGNICRSPTAEIVLRSMLAEAGIADVVVDSAGTGDWHAGDDMDARSRRTLTAQGYQPGLHTARQFQVADFAERELVVAIDQGHLSKLSQLALLADDPDAALASLVLLRSYDSAAVALGELDVPDPYYGGAEGFELVLRQVERAGAGLLAALAADQNAGRTGAATG